MLFFYHNNIITLSPDIRVHRAGSQLKMSECQTKAGNQEFQSLNVIDNFDYFENDPWDMLNNFCFHVYAQKSLFIAENCNGYFLTAWSSSAAAPSPVSEFRVHRAGSQL